MLNKITDIHSHCGGIDMSNFINLKHPSSQNIIDLHNTIIDNDVDFAVVFPMPTTIYFHLKKYWESNIFVPSGMSDFPYQYENINLLKSISHFGYSNFLPFVSFSLRDKLNEQIKSLEELIEDHDIFGIKYHTSVEQISILDINECKLLINFADKYNLPFMIHSSRKDTCDPKLIIELAKKNPNLRFCAAHAGYLKMDFFELLDVYKLDNLFFDVSPFMNFCKLYSNHLPDNTINLCYSQPITAFNELADKYRDHMLWGSDAPWYYSADLQCESDLITYTENVNILKKSTHIEQVSKNTIRYLFGKTY